MTTDKPRRGPVKGLQERASVLLEREDWHAGPWYLIRNNLELPSKPCLLCERPITRAHASFFQLMAGEPGWEDAVLHPRCGSIIHLRGDQARHKYPIDLIWNA